MKIHCKHNISIWRTAFLLGLVVTVILQTTLLSHQCYGIRQEVLRLHILANSDSAEDQAIKLQVRDALLSQGAPLLAHADTREELLLLTRQNLDEFNRIARSALSRLGCDQTVTCRLTDTYFNTRTYDTVTLPAGTYTALQVVLGEGKGQNWWCVIFPSLCLPAAEESQPVEEVLTPGQADLVEQGERYRVRFKVVEWFQSLWCSCKEWF